jgi:hypothetical protein
MCFRGAPIAATICTAIAVLAAPPVHAESLKLTICEGISAEQASRLNTDYHGKGALRRSVGQVTIKTPCGPVVFIGGGGYARPASPMLDGKLKGPSSPDCVVGYPLRREVLQQSDISVLRTLNRDDLTAEIDPWAEKHGSDTRSGLRAK